MRKFLKILKWSGVVLLIIFTGLYITVIIMQDRKFDVPYPNVKATTDSAVVARGKSLVYGPAHCANCHTSEEMDDALHRGEEVALSGGRPFILPLGTIYTRNLTPDKETGIGNMTDGEIARLLRYGVRANGTAVLDIMPFHNTSDADLSAIISYLRQQQPVTKKIPDNNLNLLGKAVQAFVIKPVYPSGPVPLAVKEDTTAAYGEYIANSIANCRGCHTNRDLMTGAFIGEDYAGGLHFEEATDTGKYALITPNLTPDKTGRITGWSQQQFIDRFRMGPLVKGTHMPWGPFSRMSDNELKAIYNFLKTTKPVRNEVKVGWQKQQ
jgi:mono/diheme cytochrome c family protein